MRLLWCWILALACVPIAFSQNTPTITSGGIVNGAGAPSVQGVAPGSLASIFGTNLASTMAISSTVPLSTSLNSVTVTFNNIAAPIQYVSANQVNIQVPWETLPAGVSSSTAQMVFTNDSGNSTQVTVSIVAVAPALYNLGGQAIAYNLSDGSLVAPANSIPGIPTHPAVIGDPNGITLFATGLGPVDSPVQDGASSSGNALNPPMVLIGGMAAQVTFAGLSPQLVGVNQINVVIPTGTPTGNAVPLQIQAGGVNSNTVAIAISQ